MVDIPWPTSSNPGNAPGEGAGRLINCYAFKDGTAARWRPLPGLLDFAALSPGEVRGALSDLGLVIAAVGNKVFQIDSNGGVTPFEETLPGDGPITIARNNAVTSVVTITTSVGAFVLNNGVVQAYPDGDLPSPNSVAFLDGYFLWTTASGLIYASDLNSTNVNPLSFAQAEARLDGLLRGVVYGEQFLAFGGDTIEVWQDAGTLPFPLSRSNVIPIGLLSQWAIAGFEDGWGGPLIFVANNGSVVSLDGYTPNRISSEDLEGLIAEVADKTTLRAAIYTFGGNLIWSLSSPDWTWEYNVTTGEWHERQSYLQSRWRGGVTIKAFGKWLVASVSGGSLYALDGDTRTESSYPMIWGMDSGPVKEFPSRIQVPGAAFDFVLGQAPIAVDPQVMLSWSHDGGATWAIPVTRSLGKQGRYFGRCAINRVGLTTHHGVRWRFRISDPVYSSFAGARMDAVGRH